MSQDIVLLTVDSWRYDTADLVPNLADRLPEQSEVITAGAATNWVFPAILSGTYYPDAYDADGNLREDVQSLPKLLSDAGYETAGFVACNPYVSKWESHFDTFWNGGLGSGSTDWYSNTLEKWVSRGYRTAFLKKRVPASEIARRASSWYADSDGPRFLWMHLMEPHLPYYPGLSRAREVGLFDSYRSIVDYQRNGNDSSDESMAVQRALYDKCVEAFDSHVPDLLDFVDDDAVVVSFGDHGEEFDHGHYDHERVYDECVRVPLFAKNLPQLSSLSTVRQLDLAPTILSEVDVEAPSAWSGEQAASLDERPALFVTPQPDVNLLHTGIRTETTKLIKSYDRETGRLAETEAYDLAADPDERENVYPEGCDDDLEARLDEFVAEHEPALEMDAATGLKSDVVEARLQDLGYK